MLTRQFPGAAGKQQKPYGVREAERATAKGRNARYQKTANARRNMRGMKPNRCPRQSSKDAPSNSTVRAGWPHQTNQSRRAQWRTHMTSWPLSSKRVSREPEQTAFPQTSKRTYPWADPFLERATSPAEHADTFSENTHHTRVKCGGYTARRSKPARHSRASTKGSRDGIASHPRTT